MLSEKLFLEALQKNDEVKRICGCKIYYGEANEGAGENVLVLNAISHGSVMEAGAAWPLFQLDVYHKDKFRAVEIADALLTLFYRELFIVDDYYLAFGRMERLGEQKSEDGTWRVPLEIKLLVKEIC